jgi:trimeric autotransporter adhesin
MPFRKCLNPSAARPPWPLLWGWAAVLFSCLCPAAAPGAERSRVEALSAYAATLVRDINPQPVAAGGTGFSVAHLLAPDLAVFSSSFGGRPDAVWRTNGTPAGTDMVRDLCLGCGRRQYDYPQAPSFLWFSPAKGKLFFTVDFGAIGNSFSDTQLWATDGTVAGTVMPLPGRVQLSASAKTHGWSDELGLLFFGAEDPERGFEHDLWVTDGSLANTRRLGVAAPPGLQLFPEAVIPARGRVFVLVDERGQDFGGAALWTSDGTSAGTVRLTYVDRSCFFTSQGAFYRKLPFLLFNMRDGATGCEPWVTDGTPSGTHPLADLHPGAESTRIASSRVRDDKLLFVTLEADNSQRLWVTDGSTAGTQRISPPLKQISFASGFHDLFTADDGSHGVELWRTDGTASGTRLVRDFCPGSCSGAGPVTTVGGRSFLPLSDTAHGSEPGITDGTASGTRVIANLCRGKCSSAPSGFVGFRNEIVFAAQDTAGRRELWRTNGTYKGTSPITTFRSRSAEPFPWFVVGGSLLFLANDGVHGRELWTTGGAPANTRLLRDIGRSAGASSSPREIVGTEDGAVFVADDGNGSQVWESDGTAAGTQARTALTGDSTASGGTSISHLTRWRGQDYFVARRAGRTELRVSSGIPGDDVAIATLGGSCHLLQGAGNYLYFFRAEEGSRGLWRTDGTAAGTAMIQPGIAQDCYRSPQMAAFLGKLFFRGSGGYLWETDGSTAGTVLAVEYPDVAELTPAGRYLFFTTRGSSGPPWLAVLDGVSRLPSRFVKSSSFGIPERTAIGDRLLFVAESGNLWVSDGTDGGTQPLTTVFSPISYVQDLTTSGSLVFFSAKTVAQGRELWASDGTAAGTRMVVDLEPGPMSALPFGPNMTPVPGGVVFGAAQGATGLEVWQSDGTAHGTVLVGDIEPGAASSYARNFATAADGTVFLQATTSATGSELWVLRP